MEMVTLKDDPEDYFLQRNNIQLQSIAKELSENCLTNVDYPNKYGTLRVQLL